MSTLHVDPELRSLANRATEALLKQQLVEITHPADWERNGYPLPWKRNPKSADGSVTQEYRPLALLEYVDECLRDAAARESKRARQAAEDDEL